MVPMCWGGVAGFRDYSRKEVSSGDGGVVGG